MLGALADRLAPGIPARMVVSVAVPVGIGYLVLCRLLRSRGERMHNRILLDGCEATGCRAGDAAVRKDGTTRPTDRIEDHLGHMTVHQAWLVLDSIFSVEFPFLAGIALQFALFRTFGIPSISRLLKATSEMGDRDRASKRYADTEVLICEFTEHPPESTRAQEAIARMNYLHEQYIKAGKISNDDMLYTLSLFALEPIRWVRRHGWRPMSAVEKCSQGVFWRYVGACQAISFAALPSCPLEPIDPARPLFGTDGSGWRDGLHFLDELEAWSSEYGRKQMVYADSNKDVAGETVEILLWTLPGSFRPFGRSVVSALMDDQLRVSVGAARPTDGAVRFVSWATAISKFMIRHLFLPDFSAGKKTNDPTQDSTTGRIGKLLYVSQPWYVKPTVWNRYLSVQAVLTRLRSRPVPGDGGDRFCPAGFCTRTVGPARFARGGDDEMDEMRTRVRRWNRCIFAPDRS